MKRDACPLCRRELQDEVAAARAEDLPMPLYRWHTEQGEGESEVSDPILSSEPALAVASSIRRRLPVLRPQMPKTGILDHARAMMAEVCLTLRRPS